MKKPKEPNAAVRAISLDAKPRREFKLLSEREGKPDGWNMRLFNLATGALPITPDNSEASHEARTAVCQAMVDMSLADPVEAILVTQLLAASEASLGLYRKGWQNMPKYFEAGTKFIQLADKAARTVALLTERLDHHRGRGGQQQITVKHVTTNNVTADQAIIAESVTTGGSNVAAPALLAASSERPMPILDETRLPEPVGVGRVEKKK